MAKRNAYRFLSNLAAPTEEVTVDGVTVRLVGRETVSYTKCWDVLDTNGEKLGRVGQAFYPATSQMVSVNGWWTDDGRDRFETRDEALASLLPPIVMPVVEPARVEHTGYVFQAGDDLPGTVENPFSAEGDVSLFLGQVCDHCGVAIATNGRCGCAGVGRCQRCGYAEDAAQFATHKCPEWDDAHCPEVFCSVVHPAHVHCVGTVCRSSLHGSVKSWVDYGVCGQCDEPIDGEGRCGCAGQVTCLICGEMGPDAEMTDHDCDPLTNCGDCGALLVESALDDHSCEEIN